MLGLTWQSENLTLALKTPVLLLNFCKCRGEINVKVLRKPYTQARNYYYYFTVCLLVTLAACVCDIGRQLRISLETPESRGSEVSHAVISAVTSSVVFGIGKTKACV